MLHQHNSCHLVKDISTSVGLRKAFQKSGFGKWLEPRKFYEFVSSNRTTAAWTISFSEKHAAVSLCRLFLCSRWNLPLRCWQSQMKLKVSWIGSFDMLSSLCSMSFQWGVNLPFGHVRFLLPNWAKLRFRSARRPISKHKTLFRLSILPKKMTLPLRIKYKMLWISVISSAGLFPLWLLPVWRSTSLILKELLSLKKSKKSISTANRSMFSHDNLECNNLNNALLKLDLNPIHPAFHKHAFKSHPYDISTLISWVSADISTASPFCKAGIFVSSSWVLHRMMCPMCPWVRNRLGWNISNFSHFNWRLFTWRKPDNQSLRAAAI